MTQNNGYNIKERIGRMRGEQENMVQVLNGLAPVCKTCIYRRSGECNFSAIVPSSLDGNAPKDCATYEEIVQRKYEEDCWRLQLEDERYWREQEMLMDDDD